MELVLAFNLSLLHHMFSNFIYNSTYRFLNAIFQTLPLNIIPTNSTPLKVFRKSF